jgi:membrane protease YdiL (CAAX protease family)
MMKLKTWLLSGTGVVVMAIVLTLIVLAESIFPPWAPYFIIYAVLAIVIPLALKTYQFGSFGTLFRTHWKLIFGIFAVALIVDEGIFTLLYQRILDGFGVGGDAYYSLNAAVVVMTNAAARKLNITPDTALLLYAFFLIIWAPIGEELFYRGYLQGALRKINGFKVSALISSAFFGIRHATHLFFLWPNVPWIAAASWVVSAFVFGLFMSYLYEKTRSLYPTILVHATVNIIEIALSL